MGLPTAAHIIASILYKNYNALVTGGHITPDYSRDDFDIVVEEGRGSGFIAGDIFSYHPLNPWLHRPQSPISSGPMS
ncbi:MAG: hypothetical protein QW784_06335 [Acidilobaceae archaeon]